MIFHVLKTLVNNLEKSQELVFRGEVRARRLFLFEILNIFGWIVQKPPTDLHENYFQKMFRTRHSQFYIPDIWFGLKLNIHNSRFIEWASCWKCWKRKNILDSVKGKSFENLRDKKKFKWTNWDISVGRPSKRIMENLIQSRWMIRIPVLSSKGEGEQWEQTRREIKEVTRFIKLDLYD